VQANVVNANNSFTGDVQIVNLSGNVAVSGGNLGVGPFSITALGAGSVLTVLAAGHRHQRPLSTSPPTI
jgi:hypothetical protein